MLGKCIPITLTPSSKVPYSTDRREVHRFPVSRRVQVALLGHLNYEFSIFCLQWRGGLLPRRDIRWRKTGADKNFSSLTKLYDACPDFQLSFESARASGVRRVATFGPICEMYPKLSRNSGHIESCAKDINWFRSSCRCNCRHPRRDVIVVAAFALEMIQLLHSCSPRICTPPLELSSNYGA